MIQQAGGVPARRNHAVTGTRERFGFALTHLQDRARPCARHFATWIGSPA